MSEAVALGHFDSSHRVITPVLFECYVQEERVVYKVLNSAATLIQRTITEAPQGHMYYIGLDVHKKTISYCVNDPSGQVHQEGRPGRNHL